MLISDLRGKKLSKIINSNKIEQFDKDLRLYSIKLLSKYLYEFYQKNPQIGNSIKHFLKTQDGSFIDPWFNTEFDSFQFSKIPKMLEEFDVNAELGMKKIEEEFGIDLSKIFPVKYTLIRKLTLELKDSLEEDGILENIQKGLTYSEVRAYAWMATTKIINSLLNFRIKLWDNDKKHCIIPWPVTIDSYIRDFELYFKFIIRPILNEKNVPKQKYHEDLEAFFAEDKNLLATIQREILKPWLRSKLAHHQYYILPEEKTIKFFQHYEEDPEEENEFSFVNLTNITVHLNFVLWITILIICEKNSMHQILEELELLNENHMKLLVRHPLYEKIKNLDILTNNEYSKKLLINLNNLKKDRNLPQAFIESKQFLRISLDRIDLEFDELSWIFSKVGYLVYHSLVIDRFVKPVALNLNPNLNNYSANPQLMKEVYKYRNGYFKDLFKWLDLELRNNLAHYSYLYDNKKKNYYYINERKKRIEINIGIISEIQNIFDRMEITFSPSYESDFLKMSIVKLTLLLFYRNKDLKNFNFYQNASDVLTERVNFKIKQVISLIASAFLKIECHENKLARYQIEKANMITKNFSNNEIEVIWAWIIHRSNVFLPNLYVPGLKLFLKYFTVYPKNKFVLAFKVVFFYNNKEIRKAKKLMQKL